MSEVERNKGVLIPIELTETDFEEICKENDFYRDDHETWEAAFEQEGGTDTIVKIGDQYYFAEFEVRRDTDGYFADIQKDASGRILFHMSHYNGGAHWTEVVADGLKNLESESK